MNEFLTDDFNRTGRAGILIDIGNGKERGASRAINLDHNNSDRNSDIKGNSNITRGLRFSNISSRDNPRFSSQDNNVRRKYSNHRDQRKDSGSATTTLSASRKT
ncbi:MAG TPA: hypothetical protein VN604_10620 [Nitrospirota bacterium]|nr:hypothetical protein [Nitrospirota bacterium]